MPERTLASAPAAAGARLDRSHVGCDTPLLCDDLTADNPANEDLLSLQGNPGAAPSAVSSAKPKKPPPLRALGDRPPTKATAYIRSQTATGARRTSTTATIGNTTPSTHAAWLSDVPASAPRPRAFSCYVTLADLDWRWPAAGVRAGLEQALSYPGSPEYRLANELDQERVKLAALLRAADRRAARVIGERRKALRWRFVWAVTPRGAEEAQLQPEPVPLLDTLDTPDTPLQQLRARLDTLRRPELRSALCEPAPEPICTPLPRLLSEPAPMLDTPLQQPAAPNDLSPVFDEVASPQPAVVGSAALPQSPMRPLPTAALPPPSAALPVPVSQEPARARRRRVPLLPLPSGEAARCEVNVCFSREAHGRKEKRERPPRLRDKGSGVLLEHSKREDCAILRFCFLAPRGVRGVMGYVSTSHSLFCGHSMVCRSSSFFEELG